MMNWSQWWPVLVYDQWWHVRLIKPAEASARGQSRRPTSCCCMSYITLRSGITVDLWPGHTSLQTAVECFLGRKQLWLLGWGMLISHQEIWSHVQLSQWTSYMEEGHIIARCLRPSWKQTINHSCMLVEWEGGGGWDGGQFQAKI